MDDLISRQAAIDALKNDMASLDHIIKGMSAYDVRLDAYVSQRNQVNCDIDTINNLPTAQPERLGTNLSGVGTDMISRQTAIDAVTDELDMIDHVPQWVFDRLEKRLKQLPPAQPETTTVTIGRTRGGITMWYKCDACDEPVDQNDNYCRNCGRKLKHE